MSGGKSKNIKSRPLRFVAVLLGVGHIRNEKKSREFAKKVCEEIMLQTDKVQHLPACEECKVCPKGDITAETAVIQLIKKMEDNPDLNCGLGSNLNMEGQVECDAGLMSSSTKIWTGVGAVSGCKNPILLAKSLYDHQSIARPLGLAQPDVLIGSLAEKWMHEHCPELSVPGSELISPRAHSQYQKLKANYESASAGTEFEEPPRKKQRQKDEVIDLETVGAIAVDDDYNFAAAVSSGGTLLKHKGSIGQAAVPGGGCWAGDRIAVATTAGEHSIRNLTARSVAKTIQEARYEFEPAFGEPLKEDMEDLFGCITIPQKDGGKSSLGSISVFSFMGDRHFSKVKDKRLYFQYAHNTDSMCIGYMTKYDSTGLSTISKQKRKAAGSQEITARTVIFPVPSSSKGD